MTTKEELRARIERLEEENEQLKEQNQPSPTRRRLIRGAALAGVGTISLAAAAGTAAAAPSGTYPVETDDPFFKLRLDRLRYISRDSTPPAPGSGRVVSYIHTGDLP